MMSRIMRALRKESHDPQTMAAGKEAAGAALIVDGLVGLENPFDGKKTRAGVLGSFGIVPLGVILIAVGIMVGSGLGASGHDVVVDGVIVDFIFEPSESNSLYRPIVSYTDPATGTEYEIEARWSSAVAPTNGSTTPGAFSPDDPANGKAIAGFAAWIKWGLILLGIAVALTGLVRTALRLGSIFLGFKLFFSGRRERRAAGDERGTIRALADGAEDVIDEVVSGPERAA
jgi:hypothetical protein